MSAAFAALVGNRWCWSITFDRFSADSTSPIIALMLAMLSSSTVERTKSLGICWLVIRIVDVAT